MEVWSTSNSCCFTPGKSAHGINWISWLDLRAGLNVVEKRREEKRREEKRREESVLCRKLNRGRPACSPSLYRLSILFSPIVM
jgi:hypothetical protein